MIYTGDCVEVMAQMDAASVDAIVTDPPYGLEFMGKEWDRLIPDSPNAAAWAGRRGTKRMEKGDEETGPTNPWGKESSGYRGGERHGSKRCRVCGKRQFSGTPCKCPEPDWETVYASGPPSGAIAMGRWHQVWATEAFRIAKPGAYLLAFGGTRTYHRMTCAIEDAGWIIRDCLVWAYASGFPKSRALLKPAWEPIVMARKPGPLRELAIDACRIVGDPTATMDEWEDEPSLCVSCAEDAENPEKPGTPATRASTTRRRVGPQRSDWETFGGMFDEADTSASNGTTDRDGIPSSTGRSGRTRTARSLTGSSSTTSTETKPTTDSPTCISCGAAITPTTIGGTRFDTATGRPVPTTPANTVVGRWPSNVLLSSPIFDGDTPGVVGGGEAGGGFATRGASTAIYGGGNGFTQATGELIGYGDSGTYSRFFLIPKADRAEREPVLGGLSGLELLDVFRGHQPDNPKCEACGLQRIGALGAPACSCEEPRWAPVRDTQRRNSHPTVKPLDLMRHLVRLVTPSGGVVLDPFLGSGTTALAAEMEGFPWIGIEKEPEYVAIAEARLNGTQKGLGLAF